MFVLSLLFIFSDEGEYQRSSLFVSGKFADFKKQASGHVVDIAESSAVRSSAALPRISLKQTPHRYEADAWTRDEEYEDGRELLKRMGKREEEEEDERAQGRMVEEGTKDQGTEYEDYVEDDGEHT